MGSPAGPSNPTPPPGPGRALTDGQRALNYWKQNGSIKLTPRQRRRLEHKAHKATRWAA